MINERQFSSIEAAAHALADDLAVALCEAIAVRGRALLAVSGGHTPRHVFDRLHRLEVDWSRVTVTLTDERWVPADHPDSNERLVRSHLLCGPATAATFVPLFGGESSAPAGQSACEARLRALALPFDAVYLGMGDDGHIASLFPGDNAINVSNSLCIAVPATESRLPRMSLTRRTLLDTRRIFLLFSGADKQAKYAEAKRKGSLHEVPLRLILSQELAPVYVLKTP